MSKLAAIKNGGRTWQQIADDLGDGISPAMVWKVARGLCKSRKVEIALGVSRVKEYDSKTHHPRRNPRPRENGKPLRYACWLDNEYETKLKRLRAFTGWSNADLVKWVLDNGPMPVDKWEGE